MRKTLRRASTRFLEIREGGKGNDVVCKACYDELGGLVVLEWRNYARMHSLTFKRWVCSCCDVKMMGMMARGTHDHETLSVLRSSDIVAIYWNYLVGSLDDRAS